VGQKITLFQPDSLIGLFQTINRSAFQEIKTESKEQLLNVNESQYIEYILSKYRLEVPEIFESQKTVHSDERIVEVQRRTFGYDPSAGRKELRHFSVFEIPFSGDGQLFRFSPSTGIMYFNMPPVEIDSQRLIVEYPTHDTDAERIKAELATLLKYIKSSLSTMRAEVHHFEKTFQQEVIQAFNARKKQTLDQEKLVASLDIPIKPRSGVPTSFVIPGIKERKLVVTKPAPASGPYRPDFKIDEEVFLNIVKICQDLGVEMERHPSLYEGKGEQDLRDVFLLMLSPHFQSTSGEVFNKQGKTDILIRHERTNVFIAECKFWGGEAAYLKTIDQLLSYLTSRDSKVALLVFNSNRQHERVLVTIEESTPTHSCFVRKRDSLVEGTFLFDMHLPGDESRGIQMAVLCYHFPDRE
jgi:hypothetical protein